MKQNLRDIFHCRNKSQHVGLCQRTKIDYSLTVLLSQGWCSIWLQSVELGEYFVWKCWKPWWLYRTFPLAWYNLMVLVQISFWGLCFNGIASTSSRQEQYRCSRILTHAEVYIYIYIMIISNIVHIFHLFYIFHLQNRALQKFKSWGGTGSYSPLQYPCNWSHHHGEQRVSSWPFKKQLQGSNRQDFVLFDPQELLKDILCWIWRVYDSVNCSFY